MALRTSHSSANLVIDSALVVSYSRSLISGNWSYTSANVSSSYNYMMEYHRRARQSFRYVGMTKVAADSCKSAMVAKYTRSTYESIWDGDAMGGAWNTTASGEMLMAEVSASHNEDGSYDVVVNVNEDDTRMSKVGETAVFAYEPLRQYEGGEGEEGEG